MAFIETPRFPEDISFGATFGPGYSTDIVSTSSGFEQVNQNWDGSLMGGDVSHGVKTPAQMKTLNTFFRIAKGKANSFRFQDKLDYTVTLADADGYLGTGAVGTGLPTYKLYKHYENAGGSENRRIQKPVSGEVQVYRDAALVAEGAGAGQISISYTTGVITFVADASRAIASHTPGASHVFTTAADISGLAIGMKVYITGVTGTGATTLNSLAHTISNKTGSGPYTWTISTTTTGLTTSGGNAYKYPQASEALLWAGEFDTPCRFDTDQMRPSAANLNAYDWGPIPVVEKRIEDV